jgi:hypothetical protein
VDTKIQRYDLDRCEPCMNVEDCGEYIKVGELVSYLANKWLEYDNKALIYRADTIRKILKDLK